MTHPACPEWFKSWRLVVYISWTPAGGIFRTRSWRALARAGDMHRPPHYKSHHSPAAQLGRMPIRTSSLFSLTASDHDGGTAEPFPQWSRSGIYVRTLEGIYWVRILTWAFLELFSGLYSKLLHLPPLRFHCVGRCWDRTQDGCDFGIGFQTL